MSYELGVVSYELGVVSYELWISDCKYRDNLFFFFPIKTGVSGFWTVFILGYCTNRVKLLSGLVVVVCVSTKLCRCAVTNNILNGLKTK